MSEVMKQYEHVAKLAKQLIDEINKVEPAPGEELAGHIEGREFLVSMVESVVEACEDSIKNALLEDYIQRSQ